MTGSTSRAVEWDVEEFNAEQIVSASENRPALFIDDDGAAYTACPRAGLWRWDDAAGVLRPA